MLIIAFTESCDNDSPALVNFILFLLIILYILYVMIINRYRSINTISDDETELTIINTDITE